MPPSFPTAASYCRTVYRKPLRTCARPLQTTSLRPANPLPITAAGPPPAPPQPAASDYGARVDRRRRQAELIKRGQEARVSASPSKAKSPLSRRFWKHVVVQTTPEGHHTIHLDIRPVRHPQTREPLVIPSSKRHLATAIALEWDLITSAQQALKPHLVPLTSIAARALDIERDDAAARDAPDGGPIRQDVVRTVMRYLDTDTLLCWAPSSTSSSTNTTSSTSIPDAAPSALPSSLHDRQAAAAAPIVAHLATHVWPGVRLHPAMPNDSGGTTSILPRPQSETTHAVVRGWAAGLGAWELAALERAVLAGKSLCVGARLVSEWSEGGSGMPGGGESEKAERRFGAEEAAEACSIEVRWQTGMWGEVGDTHDVDREDLRRQMGSVVLLVSGEGLS